MGGRARLPRTLARRGDPERARAEAARLRTVRRARGRGPTTSLPERLGGERNWDYRYCWIRDSAFTLEALFQLGCRDEAHSFFWWFMHATRLTRPHLRVLYRLDGGTALPERELPLAGYRGSRPVRVGNDAPRTQEQLDIYGDLLDTAWVYAQRGGASTRDIGAQLAEVADLVCDLWREPDRGIWEVRMEPRHFTALEGDVLGGARSRAEALAAQATSPGARRSLARRGRGHSGFIETRCWSERLRQLRHAPPAAMSSTPACSSWRSCAFTSRATRGWPATIEADPPCISRTGPLVYRYTGEDGLAAGEGVFSAARSGSSRRSRWRAGVTKRPAHGRRCSPSRTTSASTRRSSIPRPGVPRQLSRKRSCTSR